MTCRSVALSEFRAEGLGFQGGFVCSLVEFRDSSSSVGFGVRAIG